MESSAHFSALTRCVLQVHEGLDAIDVDAWNALLRAQPAPTPFLRHEYLSALHDSGSAAPARGWTPVLFTASRDGALVGAAVAYRKAHSFGEYVFDWAWADAYQRHGLDYYPKLLAAVPFTPVPGTRLLATDAAVRRALMHALQAYAERAQLSSAHLLFMDADDEAAAVEAGWLLRHGVQFHWTNREAAPYADFADFLATLQRDKRKKIQQEQRRVQEAGIRFEAVLGTAIDSGLWDFFYRCYLLTYRAHRSTPYLTRDFFARMAATMPEHWLMLVALRGDERVAASLIAIDPEQRVAYGRYWGAVEHVPCLHFDACYYQPLQWCIAHGMHRFEGGAQGEHKMARGLLPVRTVSAHWLAHPRFFEAVANFLAGEAADVAGYVDELRERNPFKQPFD